MSHGLPLGRIEVGEQPLDLGCAWAYGRAGLRLGRQVF